MTVTPGNVVEKMHGLDVKDRSDTTTGGFALTRTGLTWKVTPSSERAADFRSFMSTIKSCILKVMNPIKAYQIRQSLKASGITSFAPSKSSESNTHNRSLMQKAFECKTSENYRPISDSGQCHGKFISPTYVCPVTGKSLTPANAIKVNLKNAINAPKQESVATDKKQWVEMSNVIEQENAATDSKQWVAMSKDGLSQLLTQSARKYQYSEGLSRFNPFSTKPWFKINPSKITPQDIQSINEGDSSIKLVTHSMSKKA